jgi:high-affinity Fe2+/Pb2+ permease
MNLKKLAIVAVVVVVGSWAYDLRDANKVQEQIEEQRSFSALKN